MTIIPNITIALSNHRPEIVPLAIPKMRQNNVIVLEEPPDDNFAAMLNRDIDLDDYLMGVDTEYPEFGRRMCAALQDLHQEGVKIVQIEPYLERLIQIHDKLSDGMQPTDLVGDRRLWPVYQAERNATGALVDFYAASASKAMNDTLLSAVKTFARADAQRFLLRDRMRAKAIASRASRWQHVYVETGQMHVGLAQAVRKRLAGRNRVKVDYLAAEVIKNDSAPMPIFGPGDILTMIYIWNPGYDQPLANLLAARSLIQNKIIIKQEIIRGDESFPHTRDEIETTQLVQKLSLAECRQLLPLMGQLTAPQARQLVQKLVADITKNRHL